MTKTIKIPAPKFEMYELVVLSWNGRQARGKITDCRFELSSETWSYQVSGNSIYFPGDVIDILRAGVTT